MGQMTALILIVEQIIPKKLEELPRPKISIGDRGRKHSDPLMAESTCTGRRSRSETKGMPNFWTRFWLHLLASKGGRKEFGYGLAPEGRTEKSI